MPSKEYTLKELFVTKLQALYDIEQEIIKALPKMAKKASHPELKAALEEHLTETETQKTRLEDIFKQMDEKPKKLKVEAIRGIVEDANWVMQNIEGNEARDAAMLAIDEDIMQL
jgi:ferritin-like metal-binding protein YciE